MAAAPALLTPVKVGSRTPLPRRPYRRIYKPLVLSVALATTTVPAQASEKGWSDASDVAVGSLIAAAFIVPAAHEDWNGALQAGGSLVVATGVTQGLKAAFPETRPDRSDRKSFPSGHTSMAFASAATLNNRYGWKAGLPAHAAAIFVGVARVQADKHFWHDVLVGAAIGEISGLLLTKKRNENVQLLPWGNTKGGGVTVAMRF
jgi:membrane-associated phospholipid phosphatase